MPFQLPFIQLPFIFIFMWVRMTTKPCRPKPKPKPKPNDVLCWSCQTCHTCQRRPRNEAGVEVGKKDQPQYQPQNYPDYVVLEAGAGRRVTDVLIFLIDNNK